MFLKVSVVQKFPNLIRTSYFKSEKVFRLCRFQQEWSWIATGLLWNFR